MPTYTITITEEQEKALKWQLANGDIQDWLEKAIEGKIYNSVRRFVEENTNLNYKKLTHEERLAIVKDTNVDLEWNAPTRVEV